MQSLSVERACTAASEDSFRRVRAERGRGMGRKEPNAASRISLGPPRPGREDRGKLADDAWPFVATPGYTSLVLPSGLRRERRDSPWNCRRGGPGASVAALRRVRRSRRCDTPSGRGISARVVRGVTPRSKTFLRYGKRRKRHHGAARDASGTLGTGGAFFALQCEATHTRRWWAIGNRGRANVALLIFAHYASECTAGCRFRGCSALRSFRRRIRWDVSSAS